MRYFFPWRHMPGGTLKLEMEHNLAGSYEILNDKYFLSISPFREEIEEKLGELRVADVSLKLLDQDRKFRDSILVPGTTPIKFKALYDEHDLVFLDPRAIDLDGSTEYVSTTSTDFDMNGPEEVTNTGFETDTAGWTLNTTSARNGTQAHTGSWSLRDTGSGTPNYNEYAFGSNRSFQVTVEVWIWINAAPPSGNATLQLLDASNNVLASRNANNGTVGAWQKLVLNLDTTLVRKIRLVNTTTITVYWDDMSLTRGYDFTVAAWLKGAAGDVSNPFPLSHSRATGNDNAWSFMIRAGTNTKLSVEASSPPVFVEIATGTTVFNNAFHLVVATYKRSGNLQLFVDGVADNSQSISTVGRLDSSTTDFVLGARSSFHDLKWAGLLGEVMIIKGWAADPTAVADWFANGIVARHDTIGFWRWQDRNTLGRDYSAKSNHLTMVNLDTNDIRVPFWYHEFDPYRQRAQVNESLFYGIVDLETVDQDEKKDVVDLYCYSPLRTLSEKKVQDLYAWIQANGYETRGTIHGYYGQQLSAVGYAVRVRNVLLGMATLMGLNGVEIEHPWTLNPHGQGGIPSQPFDNWWFITNDGGGNGVIRGVFDQDLQVSQNSFEQFSDCLTMIKHLQRMFASVAFIRHYADSDTANLVFKYRGGGQARFSMNGTLLSMKQMYRTTSGVRVSNAYHPEQNLSPDGVSLFLSTTLGQFDTQNGFDLQLPIKTLESTFSIPLPGTHLVDYRYSYLYVSGGVADNFYVVDYIFTPRVQAVQLHQALAHEYNSPYGGRKTIYERKFHRLTGSREGATGLEAMRVLEHEEFLYRDSLISAQCIKTEFDVTKNEATIQVFK